MLDFIKLIDEEISDFDKSTFDIKDHLAPQIWENETLKPEIKNTLIKIARDFFDDLELEGVEILDITLTGSLANYNWSEYSDVDLHIIADFSKIDENIELVKGFFNAKKGLWNRVHEILIKGYEVEIYVQDVNEPHASTGIYSLITNDWLAKPEVKSFEPNWDDISLKAESLMDQIDQLQELYDDGLYDDAYMTAIRLKDRLKKLRQSGLEAGGEFSVENLAFKVLRRTGKIGDLMIIKNLAYDLSKSVNGPPAEPQSPSPSLW